ncbi:MAG: serine/threonine protein kinase [Planctomycetes bacterium]|nr:serine/threonine protein kinase [Planctomycetota bacterium]
MSGISDGALEHLRAALSATPEAGTRYELVREIGRGGMGVVYLARDRELEREVALKVLAASLSTKDAADRLRREAKIAAGLEHPGIVPVHDVGVLPDGRPFYVMKHVQGARLDEIARSAMPLRAKLDVFLRVCEATGYAHARGVLHRDLKPENVRVGGFGEVLVLDFGVAKLMEAAERAGTVVGTPGFMAPEQARGESDLDARADIHALGAILRELAGQTPPRALAAIVGRATAQLRDERYANAEALAADVRAYLSEDPVSALPENFPRRMARLASRHRVALALVGGYLALRVVIFFATRT